MRKADSRSKESFLQSVTFLKVIVWIFYFLGMLYTANDIYTNFEYMNSNPYITTNSESKRISGRQICFTIEKWPNESCM